MINDAFGGSLRRLVLSDRLGSFQPADASEGLEVAASILHLKTAGEKLQTLELSAEIGYNMVHKFIGEASAFPFL